MEHSIEPSTLNSLTASGFGPQIVDVRRRAAFEAGDAIIRAAIWRDPDDIEQWHATLDLGRDIIVYCVHGHEVSQTAASVLRSKGYPARYVAGGFEAWRDAGYFVTQKPGKPSVWITRERPKIDRIACPWLIRRFIDPDARFVYVPAERVLAQAGETGAIAYDIPGVDYSHEGNLCSFDIFIRRHDLTDPPLLTLAKAVRGADTNRLDLDPVASGLYSISLGLSANIADDHAMLRQGMVIYDALYRWYADLRQETHNWPPKMTA